MAIAVAWPGQSKLCYEVFLSKLSVPSGARKYIIAIISKPGSKSTYRTIGAARQSSGRNQISWNIQLNVSQI